MPMPRPGFCWAKVLRSCGSSFSVSPMLVSPCWNSDSPPIEVIGTVDSRFGRRMREPVTTIDCSLVGCSPVWAATSLGGTVSGGTSTGSDGVVAGGGASCAKAGLAKAVAMPNAAKVWRAVAPNSILLVMI